MSATHFLKEDRVTIIKCLLDPYLRGRWYSREAALSGVKSGFFPNGTHVHVEKEDVYAIIYMNEVYASDKCGDFICDDDDNPIIFSKFILDYYNKQLEKLKSENAES